MGYANSVFGILRLLFMNMLEIIQIPVLTDNYIYLLNDPVSGETAVVDPALAQPVLDLLAKKGWRLTYILNTHHHDKPKIIHIIR